MNTKSQFTVLLATSIFLLSIYSVAHAEITRTLRVGDRGDDVRELQVFLNQDPETRIALSGVGAPGYESTYFGNLTRLAVNRFQIKYALQVLTPAGLSGPTGVVGPLTRALIYKLSWQTPTPVVTTPTVSPTVEIAAITPQSITSSPQQITLTGSGFTPNNNTVIVVGDPERTIGSFDAVNGMTITFSFSEPTIARMKMQLAPFKNTSSFSSLLHAFVDNLTGATVVESNGTLYLRVILKIKNSNGQSNAVPVMIDVAKTLQ